MVRIIFVAPILIYGIYFTLKIGSTCNNAIRYYISVLVEQTVVHTKIVKSEDCVHQLCTFTFTPNSTQNAGTYSVIITVSGASENITSDDNLRIHHNFIIQPILGN